MSIIPAERENSKQPRCRLGFTERRPSVARYTGSTSGLFMSPRSAPHAILSEIAPFDGKDDDDLRVVIETPKGSRNKYNYDPECDCLELASVLPEGMTFPYDFGFVPSTLGDDGD